jgi:hypothetical protein
MIRCPRASVPAFVAALAWSLTGMTPALAAPDPCQGLLLRDGEVRSARRLPARATLAPDDEACVRAVGAALVAQGGVRSVTVAVRLSDGQRAAGEAPKVGATYVRLLAAGGVPEARISFVAPSVASGEIGQVAIAYVERRSDRPVARLDAVDGVVRRGPSPTTLVPAARGDQIAPETWIESGPRASAWLELADGSRLRLGAGALVQVGRLYLNEQLRRVVQLKLERGQIEADVTAGGQGSSFEISTRTTVAGVRGTRFRLTADERGSRLETLEGLVTLSGDGRERGVAAGRGAEVTGASVPVPAPLLPAPEVVGPLTGPLQAGAALRLAPVVGATAYRAELARDAEFSYDARSIEGPEPALAVPGDLPPGRWFWRAAALDARGLRGQPSRIHAFDQPGAP